MSSNGRTGGAEVEVHEVGGAAAGDKEETKRAKRHLPQERRALNVDIVLNRAATEHVRRQAACDHVFSYVVDTETGKHPDLTHLRGHVQRSAVVAPVPVASAEGRRALKSDVDEEPFVTHPPEQHAVCFRVVAFNPSSFHV